MLRKGGRQRVLPERAIMKDLSIKDGKTPNRADLEPGFCSPDFNCFYTLQLLNLNCTSKSPHYFIYTQKKTFFKLRVNANCSIYFPTELLIYPFTLWANMCACGCFLSCHAQTCGYRGINCTSQFSFCHGASGLLQLTVNTLTQRSSLIQYFSLTFKTDFVFFALKFASSLNLG